MNKYEITVIVNPSLDEEAVNAEYAQIQEMMEKYGVVIEKVDDWGKRKLAYEINKISDGYYRFFYAEAEPQVPAEIEARIRLRENILRYLIIRTDAK